MSFFQNGEVLIVVGPRGELPGRCEEWNEVCYGKLRKLLITHGRAINSIQMGYERQNSIVYSHRRGGDGDKFDSISLEPWEAFTVISGHYGAVDDSGKTMVRSLIFVSNRRTYGPFGQEEGTPFSFSFQPGLTFWGFHGRSCDDYLRAIGVYVATNAKQHFEPEPLRVNTSTSLYSASRGTEYRHARLYV
uniref:Agglutinin n=1 Tax=Anthurium amnicola TaxID=1678845 RepID=A0A1D1Y636_9ARAE